MKRILILLAIVAVIVAVGIKLRGQERPRLVGPPLYASWVASQPKFGPRGNIEEWVMDCEVSYLDLGGPSGSGIDVKPVATFKFDLLKGSDDDRELAFKLEQRILKAYRESVPTPLDDARRSLRHP